jgi:pimeloyl-ACP methyl ester carboxylesterase
MKRATVNGVEIAYLDEGSGESGCVVLVHGFASNANVNWVETGWLRHLTREGFRVIAVDNRGHGESQKFYDVADYSLEKMAADIDGLMTHLELSSAHIIGYSMGARITMRFCGLFPQRVRKASIGGAGGAVLHDRAGWADVAEALTSSDGKGATLRGKIFRDFAIRTGSDLPALAACVMGVLDPIDRADLEKIDAEMLIAVGTRDDVTGDPYELSAAISDSRVLQLEGKDHMSAVGDRVWKTEILDFFGL